MDIILPGQYPRSEQLIAATRNFDRKRIQNEELEKIRFQDVQALSKLQQDVNYLSTGLFAWQDLLRPFAGWITECRIGTMVRFYETNTFWKILECQNNSDFNESEFEKQLDFYFFANAFFSKQDPLIFTLPFILLFQTFSDGLPLEKICRILEKVSKKLLSFPKKILCFFEPSFGWKNIPEEEKKLSRKFLEKVKTFSDHSIFLQTSFFPLSKENLTFLYSLPVEGIGIDYYANPIHSTLTDFPFQKTLLAGVLNTQSTLIEEKSHLDEFTRKASEFVSADRILFSPNGPAELLPRNVMDNKVKNMKDILPCLTITS